jgi:D-alanyl-D-alanine carboxypeptidase/D-alanyl-D-alanine-endopeptidase (penicillin-binding protein 4)
MPVIAGNFHCILYYISGMKISAAFFIILFFVACSPQKFIGKEKNSLLSEQSLANAHVGISVYDPVEKKYLYNYQGEKYFVPASNTKIFTCYAAMKYLGDSLAGIQYEEGPDAITLVPTGDPTLLHRDYLRQPVIDFLKKTNRPLQIVYKNWNENALGSGWSWDDYNAYYMAERSPLPVYGNILQWVQENDESASSGNDFEKTPFIYSIPEVNWKVRFNTDTTRKSFYVRRQRDENIYQVTQGNEKKREQEVPFVTHGLQSALELLPDTIHKQITLSEAVLEVGPRTSRNRQQAAYTGYSGLKTIWSQPTDSMLKPLMHRSDNFFAEQTLLMVSEALLGVMDVDKITDTLLKTDFAGLPHRPRWADGSGLSRFNLFTPQDFVTVLDKMEQEFGMDRIKNIFPTGGRGTLSSYYKQDSGHIYAKTGSLNGVLALSGFLYTKKNKMLIFSVLVNNHNGNATAIRRKVETFLLNIRNHY